MRLKDGREMGHRFGAIGDNFCCMWDFIGADCLGGWTILPIYSLRWSNVRIVDLTNLASQILLE